MPGLSEFLADDLQLAGDDVSDIYLNGIPLGRKVGAGAAASFDGAGGIQAGINILGVQLRQQRSSRWTEALRAARRPLTRLLRSLLWTRAVSCAFPAVPDSAFVLPFIASGWAYVRWGFSSVSPRRAPRATAVR